MLTPEKALLDQVYLQPQDDTQTYLEELRLQNLERLDQDELLKQAAQFDSPKIDRAVKQIAVLVQNDQEYEHL